MAEEKSTLFSSMLDVYHAIFFPIIRGYEKAVDKVTDWSMPYLHKITDDFVDRAVKRHPAQSPEDQAALRKLIKGEVERRGYGQGMSQDFAEPFVAVGALTLGGAIVKTLETVLKDKSNQKGFFAKNFDTFKKIGWVGWGIMLANQLLQTLRSVPRFVAGLQGAERMAIKRFEDKKEAENLKPFLPGEKASTPPAEVQEVSANEKKFSDNKDLQKTHPNAATPIMDRTIRSESILQI